MRHASLRDLKAIYKHFQSYRNVFPHVRQDALRRRIEAHQRVWQDDVVITYQQHRKRTRVGDVGCLLARSCCTRFSTEDSSTARVAEFFGSSWTKS